MAFSELGIEKPLEEIIVITGGRTDGTQTDDVEKGRELVGMGRRVKPKDWLDTLDEEKEELAVEEGGLGVGISNKEVAVMSQVGSSVTVRVAVFAEVTALEISGTEVDFL